MARLPQFIGDECLEVGVGDVLLFVGEFLKAIERFLKVIVTQVVPKNRETRFYGMPPRVLAQDELALRHTNGFRPHDLVGLFVLEHPVLVNPRFVGKGIGADNRFVGLHMHACTTRDQLAGAHDLSGIDAGLHAVERSARVHRHHDFLKSGVAGSLSNAIDRNFDLPGTGSNACQAVGSGKPQVIVAVNRDDNVIGHAGGLLLDALDKFSEFFWRRITNGIRNI